MDQKSLEKILENYQKEKKNLEKNLDSVKKKIENVEKFLQKNLSEINTEESMSMEEKRIKCDKSKPELNVTNIGLEGSEIESQGSDPKIKTKKNFKFPPSPKQEITIEKKREIIIEKKREKIIEKTSSKSSNKKDKKKVFKIDSNKKKYPQNSFNKPVQKITKPKKERKIIKLKKNKTEKKTQGIQATLRHRTRSGVELNAGENYAEKKKEIMEKIKLKNEKKKKRSFLRSKKLSSSDFYTSVEINNIKRLVKDLKQSRRLRNRRPNSYVESPIGSRFSAEQNMMKILKFSPVKNRILVESGIEGERGFGHGGGRRNVLVVEHHHHHWYRGKKRQKKRARSYKRNREESEHVYDDGRYFDLRSKSYFH